MPQVPCRVFAFLSAVEGNWRNAIYVECGEQNCPHANQCGAVLFTADADGAPILLPAAVIRSCGGQEVDKLECMACLEKAAFVAAYRQFIDWHTDSDGGCTLRQLLRTQPLPLCKNPPGLGEK